MRPRYVFNVLMPQCSWICCSLRCSLQNLSSFSVYLGTHRPGQSGDDCKQINVSPLSISYSIVPSPIRIESIHLDRLLKEQANAPSEIQ